MVRVRLGSLMQKNETATVLHLTQKLMQWINSLNVKSETLKFLDENIGSKFLDIGLSDNFLNLTPKAKAIEEKKKEQVEHHQ